MGLTPEQWALIQPLLPPPSAALRGRPPLDERRILDAIFWKIRTSTPWYDLPSSFPSWQTCYRRFHTWQRQGFFNAVITVLDRDLRDRCGFNLRAALAAQHIHFVPLAGQAQVVIDPALQAALPEPCSSKRSTCCWRSCSGLFARNTPLAICAWLPPPCSFPGPPRALSRTADPPSPTA